MMLPENTLASLFEQLGLPSATEEIDRFIAEHRLEDTQKLHEADFWTPSQASFLQEAIEKDASWSEVVDDLNLRLHD